MNTEKKLLWLRIKGYHFDHLVPPHLMDHVTATFGGADASTRAFAAKLARKLGWTDAFARQAIDEYRKYVFLGVTADFSVTPPRKIDQVWHEHLLFSRAYREFCRDVLHQEFDHSPELVPTDEQTGVFSAQYDATLRLYAHEFNVAPPRAIWGTPKFDLELVPRKRKKPTPKDSSSDTSYSDGGDVPLHACFDGHSSVDSAASMAEFGGGGGFFGGGGGHSWGDASDSPSDSGDSGSGDGGGDGGGSGCSSGCGGGCGGE
ncbi:MAG: hypothetical protein ABIY52_01725 [Gemmatimonadaceae bacterium]